MSGNLAYQEERREELIGGKVVMMSPRPRWNHMSVAGNIYNIFSNYLRGKKCTPIQDGFDLYLDDENRFVPDFMVVCDPEKIKSDGVHGAPDLVVEVLSPSTMRDDKTRKKDAYARCGVREYWIISIESRSVEVYLPENGCLELDKIYTIYPAYLIRDMDDAEKASLLVEDFRCSLFPDLPIPLEMIFALVGN